jgi:hypothetical protein
VAELAPAQWLELIIAKAKDLRAAGVTSVSIGGVAITLAAPDPVAPASNGPPPLERSGDPLDELPGFNRPKRKGS